MEELKEIVLRVDCVTDAQGCALQLAYALYAAGAKEVHAYNAPRNGVDSWRVRFGARVNVPEIAPSSALRLTLFGQAWLHGYRAAQLAIELEVDG